MEKIYWVACNNRSRNVQIMYIIGDLDKFLNHMLDTSKVLNGLTCKDFIVKDADHIYLDPGGMVSIDSKVTFHIDDICFMINLEKIGGVLRCMDYADERMPGYRRIPQWHKNLIMPQELFDRLKKKLEDLRMTNTALQASIDHEEDRERLEKKGLILRLDKLLQMSPDEIIEHLKSLGFDPSIKNNPNWHENIKAEELIEDLSKWWESEEHEDDPADWWKSSSRSSADWWKDDIKDKEE